MTFVFCAIMNFIPFTDHNILTNDDDGDSHAAAGSGSGAASDAIGDDVDDDVDVDDANNHSNNKCINIDFCGWARSRRVSQ